jgi:bifunctional UDP-N-acetylglucosamine pyrophosphorylase/glucosamine-1-phosphate N-acetyltransferase
MSNKNLATIILAAGKGTRMKSSLPKVMHKIANREMLKMVIDSAISLNSNAINIVASDDLLAFEQKISEEYSQKINFFLQNERLGTAHAVKIGLDENALKADKILVLYGDTPLLHPETLQKMLAKLDESAICVLGFDCFDDNAYGRLVVDENENLQKIVEFKEANDEEKAISLCNSGVMALDGKASLTLLNSIDDNNAKKEYYLTDAVKIAVEKGLKVSYIKAFEDEVLGVNSRFELAQLEEIRQNQIREYFLENGVTMRDPSCVYFSYDTKIAADVEIGQNVVFGASVEIEKGSQIQPFCHIEGAKIGEGCVVGPFARIRPNSNLEKDAKVGNFVEIKNTNLGRGAKVNHLSYVGDANIGAFSNVGAGVITCNYDGFKKSKTEIGEGVFVGSNSALIAPVKIADGAMVAAGSVITKNVEIDELAFARSKQSGLLGGAKKFRDKNKK